MNIPEYISKERIPVATPESIIDKDGNAVFGTFDTQFKNLNLLECKKPCGIASNKSRLTEWEAFEVNFDECSIVSAVYNTAALGFSIIVFYDKKTKKVYSWQNYGKTHVASNLINDNSYFKTKKSDVYIENHLDVGKAFAKESATNKKFGSIKFEINAERVSPISNVSIPFGKNKPLYSEKDFFKASGYIEVNGKRYESNKNSTAIIDDHKGYYPFKAHYDWLTTMSKIKIDGTDQYFGFNLTRNQSINQDKYNENIVWLENSAFPLTPVFFTHDKKNKNIWYVKDEKGLVDIKYVIDGKFRIAMHLLFIDISYDLVFGTIYGTIKGYDGKEYKLDGLTGIGEDKTTRI